jgi:hypothetical protein
MPLVEDFDQIVEDISNIATMGMEALKDEEARETLRNDLKAAFEYRPAQHNKQRNKWFRVQAFGSGDFFAGNDEITAIEREVEGSSWAEVGKQYQAKNISFFNDCKTHRAHIIHLAGHSENGSYKFQDGLFAPADVLNALAASKDSCLHGLIFNCCNTQEIDVSDAGFVIYTVDEVKSIPAKAFAKSFYHNIVGKGMNLLEAFRDALVLVKGYSEVVHEKVDGTDYYQKIEYGADGAHENYCLSVNAEKLRKIVESMTKTTPHVHSTHLTIACRGSMPGGVEFIDKRVIEELGMVDHIPPNILHVACHAKRNDGLEGGLDFSGITEEGEDTLDYVNAAFKICDWCGMANGAKTDLIFFNACHSHKVGMEVLKIMAEFKKPYSKMPRIIAWEGAVPNKLCNLVAKKILRERVGGAVGHF